MKIAKLLLIVVPLLFMLTIPAEAQKKSKSKKPVKTSSVTKKPEKKTAAVKPESKKPVGGNASTTPVQNDKKIMDIVAYLEYVLNLLGSSNTPTSDKQVLVTESFSKIFRDGKVQIEDDLDADRTVITNKDVVAYLKDIDFFFQDVKFEFTIEGIEEGTNANDVHFYKVSASRNLKGTNSEGVAVNTTIPRYIEINYNPADEDFKIESIYTNEFDERGVLKEWWKQLSYEWKTFFKTKFTLSDSLSLADIQNIIASESLDLNGNPYIQNIGPLGQFVNLKSLNLSQTNISDLTPIRNLTELTEVFISNTKVKDLQPLKYADKLISLNISHTDVSDITVVQRMPKLQQLNLSYTPITDFAPLHTLQDLRELNLEATSLQDFSALADQVQLTNLNISKTNIQQLTPINAYKNLVTLNIDSTRIGDISAASSLDNLKVLHANYTLVSDLHALLKLPHLEKIYCDQTSVKRDVADAFMAANPKVLVVYDSKDLKLWWGTLSPTWQSIFSTAAKTSTTPSKEELAKVTNLDSLNVSGNHSISDLEPVAKLQKLRVLIAGNTAVKDLSPLQSHKEIKYLDLSETAVTNLSHLSQFKKLKVLKVDKSKIESIEPLYAVTTLEKIYADNTSVNDINAQEFLVKIPKCLIIYKTTQINRWWRAISPQWKEVLYSQMYVDTTSTRENLHQLIERETLHFKDVQVSDLSALSEFVRLRELHFSGTSISEIPPLENIKALKSLHASNSPLQKIEALNLLTLLEDLDISNTPIDELKVIGSLKELKSFTCAGTQIKKLNALEDLQALEYLDCSNTRVSNLDPLNHHALKTLKCYNTKVSGREVESFKKSNPDCNVVYYR